MVFHNKKKSLIFFLAVFTLYTLVYMTKNCFSAAMAATVSAGVLTKPQTGLINAVFYFLYAPLQLVGGALADRRNPIRLIQIGLIGGAIANAVIFFFPHYGVMLAAWGFNAVIQMGVWPAVIRIISSWLHPDQRKRATFCIAFSTSLGLTLAYLAAAFIGRWENNFSFSSIVLLLLAGGFYALTRRMHIQPDSATKEAVKATKPVPTTALLRSSGLILIAACVLLRTTVEMGVKTLSATLLMETYPTVSPSIGNLLGALILFSGIIGTLLVNATLVQHTTNLQTAMLCLFLLCLPVCGVLCIIPQLPLTITLLLLCLITAATSGTHYVLMRCTLYFAPYGKSGMVAGLTNASAAVGIILQSTGTTLLAEHLGWSAVTISWCITIGLCALLTAIALPRWRQFTKGEDAI